MQFTPLGPWGVGASAGPATVGLKVVSGRVQNPDHIRCDQGGKGVKVVMRRRTRGARPTGLSGGDSRRHQNAKEEQVKRYTILCNPGA